MMQQPPPPARQRSRGRACAQRGMTLVELMVALALGLLIVLAAVTSLLVARQGFTAVDTASQLRDNGRFLQNLVQRLGAQAGYRDPLFATDTVARPNAAFSSFESIPYVFGLNNSARNPGHGLRQGIAWTTGSQADAGIQANAGSDILVLAYQASLKPDGARVDDTMTDCAGVKAANVPQQTDDRMASILHVGIIAANGEPSLMCSRRTERTGAYEAQPLISGVENFQVLYGVSGIDAGNTIVPVVEDPVTGAMPERYLRADQLTVPGNDLATAANWGQVRSIRIGVVLLGPPGSAVDRSSQILYPLGVSKDSATGATGSGFALAGTADPGTEYTPPDDGRLRQVLTFTVRVRNRG